LARFIVDTVADKKAEDIVLLDIRGQTIIADYFIICSASSERQIRAVVESIREDVKEEFGLYARAVEGEPDSGWVLIDFSDVVVHVFAPATRHYYDLEAFWDEAAVLLKMQ
jgi:ribosome-associated protein